MPVVASRIALQIYAALFCLTCVPSIFQNMFPLNAVGAKLAKEITLFFFVSSLSFTKESPEKVKP